MSETNSIEKREQLLEQRERKLNEREQLLNGANYLLSDQDQLDQEAREFYRLQQGNNSGT